MLRAGGFDYPYLTSLIPSDYCTGTTGTGKNLETHGWGGYSQCKMAAMWRAVASSNTLHGNCLGFLVLLWLCSFIFYFYFFACFFICFVLFLVNHMHSVVSCFLFVLVGFPFSFSKSSLNRWSRHTFSRCQMDPGVGFGPLRGRELLRSLPLPQCRCDKLITFDVRSCHQLPSLPQMTEARCYLRWMTMHEMHIFALFFSSARDAEKKDQTCVQLYISCTSTATAPSSGLVRARVRREASSHLLPWRRLQEV